MRIKLIKPAERDRAGVLLAYAPRLQDVALPLLAAVTPPEHEVVLVDEMFGPDRHGEPVDVVGISVWTDLAQRSYRIAEDYRRQGAVVVLGGIHPTMCPAEAARHCDAMVLGEGERAWPALLDDLGRGALQPVYDDRASQSAQGLEGLPLPRRDLYPRLDYWSPIPPGVGIEASRGCPYDCEFCSILEVRGHTYRHRPPAEVVEEIATIPHKRLCFVDDNIALDRRAAKELFRAMVGLGKEWVAEGNVSIAEDEELLALMYRSGCRGLAVGFESVQSETMAGMKKLRRLRIQYAEAVHRFHEAGINVMGNFVFGFDHETTDVFDMTLDFAHGCKLELGQFRALTPYPGTPLYDRLKREGRLLDQRWWLNPERLPGDAAPLFYPRRMSPEQLAEGMLYVVREFYSLLPCLRRYAAKMPWERSIDEHLLFAGASFAFAQRYRSAYSAALKRVRGWSHDERTRVFGFAPQASAAAPAAQCAEA